MDVELAVGRSGRGVRSSEVVFWGIVFVLGQV